MTEIERILSTGQSARDDGVEPVSPSELATFCAHVGWPLPPSYCEFVGLNGLAELRINHRVLNPTEIAENLPYVDTTKYIPLADNGCGDLYCWVRSSEKEPSVVFADHETGEYIDDADSFSAWLANNRFQQPMTPNPSFER